MLSYVTMKKLLNKFIWILYKDSNSLVSAKGRVVNVTNSEISLETQFNVLLIPLESIEKVKISKTELNYVDKY